MTDPSVFHCVPRIVQGTGQLSSILPKEVARLNAKNILIVTDPGLIDTGIPERVRNILSREHEVGIYSDVEADPSVESVERCSVYVREQKFDLIVGLGRQPYRYGEVCLRVVHEWRSGGRLSGH